VGESPVIGWIFGPIPHGRFKFLDLVTVDAVDNSSSVEFFLALPERRRFLPDYLSESPWIAMDGLIGRPML
jgi:hypothetical protein